VLIVVIATAGVAALFVAPPRPVTRQLAVATSSWMMDSGVTGGRILGMVKRLTAGYVQTAIAADIAARLDSGQAGDDVRNLARIITFVREHMLTATEFVHHPGPHAALVRGVGFCDQVNAAVATIAAAHFERAELFALVDPLTNVSPHTIGRVWSSERREWLYYDAFYADAVVFTKDAAGRPHYIDAGIARVPSRGATSRAVDRLGGATLVQFEPTYGSYLVTRVRRRNLTPSFASAPLELPVAVTDTSRIVDDAAFRKVARAFVAARVEDLFGGRPVDAYRRIAADPLAKRDTRAAGMAALAAVIADTENVTR
jgi:hypothetical protein